MKTTSRPYMELDLNFNKNFMTSLKVLYDLLKTELLKYVYQ